MKNSPQTKPGKDNAISLIMLLLVIGAILAYGPSLGGQFLQYDDEQYVTQNPTVLKGVTIEGLLWSFRFDGYAANWHPLTWMSHMLDCSIDRMLPFHQQETSEHSFPAPLGARHPLVHHVTNLLLHILATILLFLALSRMTGSPWKSGFVAALFALHPFHAESVAWVAERKDVLSGALWMATMLAYAWYAERPRVGRYLLVFFALAFGLMAKPMLVTLPFVLLLLDWWPLKRFDKDWKGAEPTVALVLEKLPLIFLAVASCLVTYIVQRAGGAMRETGALPFQIRLENSILSYAMYMFKTVVPVGLANPYPHLRDALNEPSMLLEIAGAAVLLLAITVASLWMRQRRYLAVGWLWFLGTLIPVIGLVQVGEQAYADRYTYIPLIGIFVMVAWGVPDLLARSAKQPYLKAKRATATGAQMSLVIPAIVVLVALTGCTIVQASYWHDSISLFEHALSVTTDNAVAHNNLAKGYETREMWAEAAQHYAEVVRLRPVWAEGHNNYAHALEKCGRLQEAFSEYDIAVREKDAEIHDPKAINENESMIHMNFGMALVHNGHPREAAVQFQRAIVRNPGAADAHYNLAVSLEPFNIDGAMKEYDTAIQLAPTEPKAHNNLGVLYYKKGNYAAAWREVHLCQRNGGTAIPPFVAALRQKMPEPAE